MILGSSAKGVCQISIMGGRIKASYFYFYGINTTTMKLVFATTPGHSELLNEMGVEIRLLSYFYLRSSPPNFLDVYAEKGIYTSEDNPNPKRDQYVSLFVFEIL